MPKKVDVLIHELVPKHEIATPEEVEKIKRKYGIELSQLPKISSKDPAVKAIGANPGDVVKITRKSPTAKEISVYRLVVKE
ncbi:MAG: DNA-directed RNA polymerase subunit H [Candidatus Hydrothermarchaeota archaeon]